MYGDIHCTETDNSVLLVLALTDRIGVIEKQLGIYSFDNKDGFCIGSKAKP